MELDVERFGRIVRARREQLGLQQEDLKARGGPSSTTMSQVENGRGTPSTLILRRLDKGLDWQAGSALEALSGGDPTPLPVQATSPAPAGDRRAVWGIRADVNARWGLVVELANAVAASGTAASDSLRSKTWQVAWLVSDSLVREVLRSDYAHYSREILDAMYESRDQVRRALLGRVEREEFFDVKKPGSLARNENRGATQDAYDGFTPIPPLQPADLQKGNADAPPIDAPPQSDAPTQADEEDKKTDLADDMESAARADVDSAFGSGLAEFEVNGGRDESQQSG